MAYAWPFPESRVTSEFGPRGGIQTGAGATAGHHDGRDFRATRGEAIPAIGDGTVEYVGKDQYGGWYVRIGHGGGLQSYYWHLSRFDVQAGQRITRGQPVGGAGDTGLATGVHLHLELRVNGKPVDPRSIINGGTASGGVAITEGDETMKLYTGNLADKGHAGKIYLFGPKGKVHIGSPAELRLVQRYLREINAGPMLEVEVDIVISRYTSQVS